MPNLTDQQLIQLIREQDSESAFRALFDCHYERMYRVALYFVQNEDWAKEVTLDVLAHLWEKRKTMIVPNDFRHFSFVMVRNTAINFLKRETPHDERVTLDETLAAETLPSVSPEELLEQSELFETYERLLTELPERCRQVFLLVKEEGRSYAEVAEELGISPKTVDAQLQKALGYLRKNLAHYLDRNAGKRFFSIFIES